GSSTTVAAGRGRLVRPRAVRVGARGPAGGARRSGTGLPGTGLAGRGSRPSRLRSSRLRPRVGGRRLPARLPAPIGGAPGPALVAFLLRTLHQTRHEAGALLRLRRGLPALGDRHLLALPRP